MVELLLTDLGPRGRPGREPDALPWALVALAGLAAGLVAALAASHLGRHRRFVRG